MLRCCVRLLAVVCNVYVLWLNGASYRKTEEADRKRLWGIEWSRDLKDQGHDANMLKAECLENSYLATISNYYIVCCEAVGLQAAVLATAWLLVNILMIIINTHLS